MFHDAHKLILFCAIVTVTGGCGCEEHRKISASVTCTEVFDGEYVVCHGRGWEEGSTRWCADYDHYVITIGHPYPGGGHTVEKEIRIPADEAVTRDWLVFERKIVEAREADNQICLRATEPPTCVDLIELSNET